MGDRKLRFWQRELGPVLGYEISHFFATEGAGAADLLISPTAAMTSDRTWTPGIARTGRF